MNNVVKNIAIGAIGGAIAAAAVGIVEHLIFSQDPNITGLEAGEDPDVERNRDLERDADSIWERPEGSLFTPATPESVGPQSI